MKDESFNTVFACLLICLCVFMLSISYRLIKGDMPIEHQDITVRGLIK